MLVKKYEAKDMKQAMDDIVKELGTDAVILNSRKMRKPGLGNLFKAPVMEVMVAYEPRKPGGSAAKKQPVLYTSDLPELPVEGGGTPFEAAVAQAQAAGPPPTQFTAGIYSPASLQAQQNGQNRINQVATTPGKAAAPSGDPQHKLSEIDSRIDSLDHVLSQFMDKFSYIKRDVTYDFSPEVERLFITLTENQVREELALSIAKETEDILRTRNDATAREVMYHLISESLGNAAPIVSKKYKRKVILFLGPTGVGKTTSLVKLASGFAVAQKKRVGIINTDTYRIGAHEQLKTYADILDIPLGIAYRPEELVGVLEEMKDRDVIFIDTAGKRPGDPQHQKEVQQIIKLTQPEEILLCVSASTCFSAIKEVIDTYNFVESYKLVVTKLDETRYRGMLLNLCRYAKRPLAYVTTGQNVPDDLEAADIEKITEQILEN